ncbi:hydroxyacid dehydrogenase [Candidatus Gottesmanbacteria bacterium]|nr:hydroxyacid dehydrogenase [Candidatus Gottesmanbacteria bacterium]
MLINFFEIEEWEKPSLQSAFAGHILSFFSEPLTTKNTSLYKNTEILSTFIYSQLTQEILSALPNLKLITTRSTGFNHIDIEYCQKRGIVVCHVPTYGVNTIAEHTFALILTLSRKIYPSIERTRKGDFSLDGLRGFALAGKNLGIIGLGNIGKRVTEIAVSLKMQIFVYTRHPDLEFGKKYHLTYVDLPTLLKNSDIISVHVPLTAETKHLINKENVKLFKKGAILINTSRGAVVETEAIVLALESGILSGAGLDVLEEERFLKEERELLTKEFLKTCDLKTQLLNHVLLTKENVIITPHNAFNSQEALQEILNTTIANIKAYWENKPVNRVI